MERLHSTAFTKIFTPENGSSKGCMTRPVQYAELHARSAFSFLEGASLPEALIDISAAKNIPAMALLDRNGFYGSPRFHMAAEKTGVRAHVGAEIRVTDQEGTTYY